MFVAVVGLSHRTAPVEIREQLSIPEPQVTEAVNYLCRYPHIQEAAILSTCNRLEVYIVAADAEHGVRETMQFLADYKHIDLNLVRPHLFTLLYRDAVMHLMRVSAGLDSLVLGEGQILAQVKKAQELGQKSKGMGRILNKLFNAAITTGKKVRTDVKITTGAVSISSAAVELAMRKGVALAEAQVTILGAGKMSRLLVQHLIAKGCKTMTLVNRSQERAEELASQFCDAAITIAPWESLLPAVAESDLVFASTGATTPVLEKGNLYGSLLRPVMLIDIAVPRNIAADVEDLPGVTLFNVDDLAGVVEENKAQRQKLVRVAEEILEQETEAFWDWWRSLETVETISSLRLKAETIREQELEKALSRLGKDFADKHLDVIEALTRGIVNKILHDPVVQLRAQRDIEARRAAMRTLKELFNLEEELQFQPQREQS
ncbi:MAG: glutamyl-tRNA reductase [Synechococcales cyanobacterium]